MQRGSSASRSGPCATSSTSTWKRASPCRSRDKDRPQPSDDFRALPLPKPEAVLVRAGNQRQHGHDPWGESLPMLLHDVMAGKDEFVAPPLHEGADQQLLIIAAPTPDLGVAVRQGDVVNMNQRSAGKTRQHIQEETVHIGARHGDMAGINEKDVPWRQGLEHGGSGIPQESLPVLDIELAQGRARLGIDAGDAGGKPAVLHGLSHEAGRMAGADLHDSLWSLPANDGIGRSRIEAREPALIEARRALAVQNGLEIGAMAFDALQHAGELSPRALEQRL